jgi:hypothetical protein
MYSECREAAFDVEKRSIVVLISLFSDWMPSTSDESKPKTLKMMGNRRRAAVVVLGDLGRSPRMQYHALSLANQVLISIISLVGFWYSFDIPAGFPPSLCISMSTIPRSSCWLGLPFLLKIALTYTGFCKARKLYLCISYEDFQRIAMCQVWLLTCSCWQTCQSHVSLNNLCCGACALAYFPLY